MDTTYVCVSLYKIPYRDLFSESSQPPQYKRANIKLCFINRTICNNSQPLSIAV